MDRLAPGLQLRLLVPLAVAATCVPAAQAAQHPLSPEQDFATKAQVRLQAIPNPEQATTASKTRVRVRDRVSGRVWQWRALGGQRVLESSVNNTRVAWVERMSIGKRAALVAWIRRLRPTVGPPKVIARTTVSRKLTARGKGYGDVALLVDGSIA